MEILRLIEGIRTPFLDTVIGMITQLGEETIGVIIFCTIFWCVNKRVAYGIGMTFFFSGLTVQGMKICFRVDRPWIADPTLTAVPSAMENATGYSFPSGHTQSAASLFGALGVQTRQKTIRAVCFLVAILVAFSRIYLGVHTPLDVATSLLISLLFVLLTVKILASDEINKKRELTIALIMILYTVIVIVIAAALYSNGLIEHSNLSDCLKAAGAGIGFATGMLVERIYISFSAETKSIPQLIIRNVFGLVGVIAIKEGLKIIIGTGLVIDMIRYFLMLTWVMIIFPLIIKRFLTTVTDID